MNALVPKVDLEGPSPRGEEVARWEGELELRPMLPSGERHMINNRAGVMLLTPTTVQGTCLSIS